MLNIDNDAFIWSDVHFNHHNIIKFCNRPFESTDSMNQMLLDGLKVLTRESTLFDLGDISFGDYATASRNYQNYFSALSEIGVSRLYITLGNHDKHLVNYLGSPEGRRFNEFVRVDNYLEVRYKKHHKVVMMHYPLTTWNGMFHGSYCLSGHEHKDSFAASCENNYHVGVDTIGFQPMKLDEVIGRINRRVERNTSSN